MGRESMHMDTGFVAVAAGGNNYTPRRRHPQPQDGDHRRLSALVTGATTPLRQD
jgi:hypothetical protein